MTQSSTSVEAFADREFRYTRRDFRHIAQLLHTDAGITMTEAKAPLIYARLVKRLRALGIESFSRYCTLLDGPNGAPERARMTAALTTNVTRFLREPHHFDHLKRQVLPDALAAVRAGGRLRIWSAGCSTGEEPYSIALTILAMMPDAADHDVKVLATDINEEVLQVGSEGAYSDASLAPLSRHVRAAWFTSQRVDDRTRLWRVGPALAKLVSFRPLNLAGPWPMRASYQAIFCRNVLIYFGPENRAEIWRRMAPLLAPQGRLYVGHSERVPPTGLFKLEAPTTYRRPETAQ